MRVYRILWGHSGNHKTARDAARYASEEWGELAADTPEEAAEEMARQTGLPLADYYYEGRDDLHHRVHVLLDDPEGEA